MSKGHDGRGCGDVKAANMGLVRGLGHWWSFTLLTRPSAAFLVVSLSILETFAPRKVRYLATSKMFLK